MATIEEIKPGRLFRHKGGKLYIIEADWPDTERPRWGFNPDRNGSIEENNRRCDFTKVDSTQWQINDKYPEGRTYQASRLLKIADLTAID